MTPRSVPATLRSAPLWCGLGFVVMWSSGFIGAEWGTRIAPATTLLVWRFVVIAVPAAAWIAWRYRSTSRAVLNRRDLGLYIVIGALSQAGYLYGVVAGAELGVAAGTGALIAALQPLAATVVAHRLLAEPAGPVHIIGLVVGLGGTSMVVSADYGAGAGTPLWAFALPLLAMVSLVAATVTERRAFRHRQPAPLLDALAVQCLTSAVLFVAIAAATGTLSPPADGWFWGAVAWVIVLSTVGGYGFYWLVVRQSGMSRISALLYLTPPATMVWAWLMFSETVPVLSLAGTAVCVLAVSLMLRHDRPTRPATSAPGCLMPAGSCAHHTLDQLGRGEP